jgi:hypothetical protein
MASGNAGNNRAPLAGEDIRRGVKEAFQTLSPSMFQLGRSMSWGNSQVTGAGRGNARGTCGLVSGCVDDQDKSALRSSRRCAWRLRGEAVPETVFTQLKGAASDASDLLAYFIGDKQLPADLQLAVSSLLAAIRELAAALAIHTVGGPSSSSER